MVGAGAVGATGVGADATAGAAGGVGLAAGLGAAGLGGAAVGAMGTGFVGVGCAGGVTGGGGGGGSGSASVGWYKWTCSVTGGGGTSARIDHKASITSAWASPTKVKMLSDLRWDNPMGKQVSICFCVLDREIQPER